MSWTADEQRAFAGALLGSWPGQVGAWGREGLAAYIEEVQARGMDFEDALMAARSHPGNFPPNAAQLAALIRRDPDRPTAEEMYQQVYGRGGIFGVRKSGAVVSPWVLAFADSYGRQRLRMLEVEHDQHGELIRKDLFAAYGRFLEATEGREVAAVAAGRKQRLGKFDPYGALGITDDDRQLKSG